MIKFVGGGSLFQSRFVSEMCPMVYLLSRDLVQKGGLGGAIIAPEVLDVDRLTIIGREIGNFPVHSTFG